MDLFSLDYYTSLFSIADGDHCYCHFCYHCTLLTSICAIYLNPHFSVTHIFQGNLQWNSDSWRWDSNLKVTSDLCRNDWLWALLCVIEASQNHGLVQVQRTWKCRARSRCSQMHQLCGTSVSEGTSVSHPSPKWYIYLGLLNVLSQNSLDLAAYKQQSIFHSSGDWAVQDHSTCRFRDHPRLGSQRVTSCSFSIGTAGIRAFWGLSYKGTNPLY